MCTPAEATAIRTEAGLWIQRGKLFTSVDIANSLKQRKQWIRNKDVAAYLRENLVNISPQYGGRYTKSIIDVTLPNGSSREATLYHPVGTDPSAYTATNQKALSPQEASGDNPTDTQQTPDPFAGFMATSAGVRLVPPSDYSAQFGPDLGAETDPDFDEEDEGPARLLEGLSLQRFEAPPRQEIHIHIESIDYINNLTVFMSPGEAAAISTEEEEIAEED